MLAGDTREHDMSFLDYSFAADIAPDASVLLFDEEGEAGGANYTVFVRKSDHSPSCASARGTRWRSRRTASGRSRCRPPRTRPSCCLPTGTGDTRRSRRRALTGAGGGLAARQRERGLSRHRRRTRTRLYAQAVDAQKAETVTPEGTWSRSRALPSRRTGSGCAIQSTARRLFPMDGGAGAAIAGVEPGEFPLRFLATERPSTSGSAARCRRAHAARDRERQARGPSRA
jgi:hypothetical protein